MRKINPIARAIAISRRRTASLIVPNKKKYDRKKDKLNEKGYRLFLLSNFNVLNLFYERYYSMQDTNTFEPRNYRIDNVELNWAKLAKPVNPFGTEQWEIQIATTDKAVADEWTKNHLTVKQDKVDTKKFTVSLKRKAIKRDGSSNGPVKVVDAAAQPVTEVSNIGNGSMGNVVVYQYPYETMGRKGIATSLTAVQITKMEVYTAAVEFEPVVDLASGDSNTEAPAKEAAMPF